MPKNEYLFQPYHVLQRLDEKESWDRLCSFLDKTDQQRERLKDVRILKAA